MSLNVKVINKDNGWCDIKFDNAYKDVKKKMNISKFNIGLDVGCRGYTIQNILRDHFNPAKVYGFEPYEPSFKETEARYKSDSSIHVYHTAVGDFDGESTLYYDPEKPSGSTLQKSTKKEQTVVKVLRLDTWAKEHGITTFDVVKVDTEGSELEVVKGMGDLLHTVQILIAEVRFNHRPTRLQDLAYYIRDYGLELFNFVGIYHNPEHEISWGDAIFAKTGNK